MRPLLFSVLCLAIPAGACVSPAVGDTLLSAFAAGPVIDTEVKPDEISEPPEEKEEVKEGNEETSQLAEREIATVDLLLDEVVRQAIHRAEDGHPSEAARLLEDSITPDLPLEKRQGRRLFAGMLWVEAGEDRAALEALASAPRADAPGGAVGRWNMGRALLRLDDQDSALEAFGSIPRSSHLWSHGVVVQDGVAATHPMEPATGEEWDFPDA